MHPKSPVPHGHIPDVVRVRGARENNLKNVDVDIPRNKLVVFTGVSGSGKSSLAFGTLYAEAQRRYLESVSPYARRLFNQMAVPEVDLVEGLPPAVALQQQRGAPTTRSSIGSVTTIANLLRMLYSRAGTYPKGQELLPAEAFSPNTPEGACPGCHGLGRAYTVTEQSMVPDPSLTIRERAVAAWPPAWHGQNLRDMLVTLGHDVDVPWHKLPEETRQWILFTDETPVVPVYAGLDAVEVRRAIKKKEDPSYLGNFSSARKYVLTTFAQTQSALMKKRVSRYMVNGECTACSGKRLRPELLSVTFDGRDIAEMQTLSLADLRNTFVPFAKPNPKINEQLDIPAEHALVILRIAEDLVGRLDVLLDLGLGYLSLERSTPTLSPGELQRLRLATQLRSNLFGVVYVLDEPSAGLHPSDTEALLRALDGLKEAGNSLFVVEHEVDVIDHADWIVDVGPKAGTLGGQVLYSGPPSGLDNVEASQTRRYVFGHKVSVSRSRRQPAAWLKLRAITRNNLQSLDVDIPMGVLLCVTGVSGSGKSTLISQTLVELVLQALGQAPSVEEDDQGDLEHVPTATLGGHIASGMEHVKRVVCVDQKPIGRTPRSNLATYTGLFDPVRKLFAKTPKARASRMDAGQFSFNVAKGRCEVCQGEGSVMVELLFLPSVYAPCSACKGLRYSPKTLQVKYRQHHIADILNLTVDAAHEFFIDEPSIVRPLSALREVGLGYLRLGQSATELSGGEAQRIKLATELGRIGRANTLYVLDEPTTGLHPADVEMLLLQLNRLVNSGSSVVVVEHDMCVIACADWVIDMGPGAGQNGGRVAVTGTPEQVAASKESRTAPYIARLLKAPSKAGGNRKKRKRTEKTYIG